MLAEGGVAVTPLGMPLAPTKLGGVVVGVMRGAESSRRAVRLSGNWRARAVTDPACQTGCEEVARQIQHILSGGAIHRITPPQGARFLGSYRGYSPGWAYHEVVVHEGRVYDAFTGGKGVPISEYKALWEHHDVINFGF
jgi:hypothetical protein